MRHSDKTAAQSDRVLSAAEHELIHEILVALRTMRYGSVVLTVHEGRLVEIQRTERIRRAAKVKD